jgi:hypothetical protein
MAIRQELPVIAVPSSNETHQFMTSVWGRQCGFDIGIALLWQGGQKPNQFMSSGQAKASRDEAAFVDNY